MLILIVAELAVVIVILWSIHGAIGIQTEEMRRAGTTKPAPPDTATERSAALR